MGYDSVYSLDYETFEIDGERPLNVSLGNGTKVLHVLARKF